MSRRERASVERRPIPGRPSGLSAARSMIVIAILVCLGGCMTIPRQSFSPAEAKNATPPGFANVRFDEDSIAFVNSLREQVRPDQAGAINVLALSGGGSNGAYGAGVMYGWSKSGARPDFQLVTGVSAGAPLAVFAFLGPAWDERLKAAFAGGSTEHLLQSRGLFGLLTPGLYSQAKLRSLFDGYVDDALIRAVAAEHAKGRRLLVATTDLDSERLVVWDMGAIAAHGGPEARKLFRDVMVASASIPGLFPPSFISVQGGHRQFSEMQVDGQVVDGFLGVFHPILLAHDHADGRTLRLYVLINGALDSRFDVTPDRTVPIITRALAIGEKAALRSQIIATTDYCRRNGVGLRISQLADGGLDRPLDFHPGHVRELFEAGVAAAMSGTAWRAPEEIAAIDPAGVR
jgi:Patatin-like phospholipase